MTMLSRVPRLTIMPFISRLLHRPVFRVRVDGNGMYHVEQRIFWFFYESYRLESTEAQAWERIDTCMAIRNSITRQRKRRVVTRPTKK